MHKLGLRRVPNLDNLSIRRTFSLGNGERWPRANAWTGKRLLWANSEFGEGKFFSKRSNGFGDGEANVVGIRTVQALQKSYSHAVLLYILQGVFDVSKEELMVMLFRWSCRLLLCV